ncbi:MAG TPA: MopE-related protein, partial [Chitinophagaceae bacterium]|nr:MopE-related protein [Chitinophagaceae bacterium]
PPVGYVDKGNDCKDTDNTRYPGAPEVMDGKDNDCDGKIDETDCVLVTYHRDADGDGFGNPALSVLACAQPLGYVLNNTDCIDTDGTVYPGNVESCDGKDNNCNGQVDENTGITYFRDADGDGYGHYETTIKACSPPAGYVANSQDCNDADPAIRPNATEICDGKDNDCDGTVDEGCNVLRTWYRDADKDGFGNTASTKSATTQPAGYVLTSGDCNDASNTTYPGAPELCDGADNDCDGIRDDGWPLKTFYKDNDLDGWGGTTVIQACTAPVNYVERGGDCKDTDNTRYPGAPELIDGKDNDCDGKIDEADCLLFTYYRDADGDGYGDAALSVRACTQPAGYVPNSIDCKDSDAAMYPGKPEVCDGKDNNCDGQVDEGVSATFYRDADGDGYGQAALTIKACTAPAGYVANSIDCNDADATIKPGATEVCDGKDNDCDGIVDEGCNMTLTFYRDADKDGYGNPASFKTGTVAPAGYVLNSSDCNDLSNTTYPGAPELCDCADNDCDGVRDDGWPLKTFYKDNDKDGWGGSTVIQACTAPIAYVERGGDCKDTDSTRYPGAPELMDGKDNDCDGQIDEMALVVIGKAKEQVPVVQGLQVRVAPNPATHQFTLWVESDNKQPVDLYVVDAAGRVVEIRKGVLIGSTVVMGEKYRPGTYMVEAVQGSRRKRLKLIKLSD